ncbi:MAG: DNA polymerase I [Ruminococcaceae bacterium]|nr:DNA polymerase I [Oscillospiraceae bacterium]
MEKILVIDGNSILNRAFYGVKPLTTKDGLPTNAVFGMYNILTKNINAVKPDYCAVAFDLKAPTFRHKMYDGYKATRKGMPEELARQLPYAKECVRAMGLSVLELEGYEADDILGTVASRAKEKGIDAYILTGDRDSLQLIDEGITVMLVTNKETVNFDRAHFREVYGIDPSVFVDVKALMGDSSDNIPGVAGIGEKTALKLITDFSSLDGVYSSFEESKLTPNMKEKLRSGRENAMLSRVLATIVKDVPLDLESAIDGYGGINAPELKALFERLEFFALIKKLGLDSVESSSALEISPKEETVISAPLKQVEVDASELSARIADREVAVALSGDRLSVALGTELLICDLNNLAPSVLGAALESARVMTHDAKSLYKALSERGIEYRSCFFDTMLAAYVLNSSRRGYSLGEVYLEYAGRTMPEGYDGAEAVSEISSELRSRIKSEGCESLLFDIEMPLAAVLCDMELAGVKLDTEGIIGYGEELGEVIDALCERIYCAAGEEFNIDSPKQLGVVLFEKLGLPTFKKTKTGYSTDAEVLSKLRGKHDIIEDILDYRQLSKLRSTYTDALVRLADGEGRIHTLFNQTGTATGRLSSSEPNLQNIPVRTELGRRFRKYFTAKNEDYLIVDADYSQIELRLLAHISGDENMIAAFAEGEDIHRSTAAAVFGVAPEAVTPELRKRAKAVNFGIVYGIGEFSLSEDLGISRAEAKRYIESYLEGFPRVAEYLSEVKEQARADGYVTTSFGRRRYIPELSASNKNLQHFGERVAMNSPIQGTAADIMKIAMINTARALKEADIDARLILQVHDELLLEAHAAVAEKAREILVREMESAVSLSVPLSVEANIGKTWYEAK